MSATRDRPMNADEVAHAIHRSHEQHAQKLEEIRKLLENTVLELAVGGSPNDREIKDWPVPGKRRYSISDRRATGNDGLAIPAQATPATLVVPALPGRIGGKIANSGANPCTLYLADVGRAQTGVAAIWLASAGVWDFLLGNAIWAGPVCAISANGTTLIVAQA